MTTFLVFVAVLAAGAVGLLATRRPPFLQSAGGAGGPAVPDPRLPPVLLPEQVQPADLGQLRFSVALRGYRMDQVDAVLEQLALALAERDAALAAVQGRPGGACPEGPGTPS